MRLLAWALLVGLVFLRILASIPKYKEGQKIRISQKVLSEPIKYSYYQSITLSGLRVYLPKYPEVVYGDEVLVGGIIKEGKLTNAVLKEIRQGKGPLYLLRKKLVNFYESALPQPFSGLVSGVTLGSKSGLSTDFWERLKVTGTAHVVVASGMNVTLVAGFLVAITCLFLPRRRAIPLAIAGVWGYSLLSGFDAPIIRAAAMGSVTFLAQATGRLISAWKALLFSALAMLLIWPSWIFDLGFILSFVATACLLLFEPRLRRFFRFLPEVIKEGFSTSLAAQIGVAPIIFATFGQFNILSPAVNALVLWTIAPLTIIAGGAGVIGLIIPGLGRLIIYLVYPLAFWFVKVIETFS